MARLCVVEGCEGKQHARGMCEPHYQREWRKENRTRLNAYHREAYRKNRDERLAYLREYREKHPQRIALISRKHHLKKKFGLASGDFERMLDAQDGVCAVCGGSQTGERQFAVDHDHATGRVRGLLCTRCNVGIGGLRDDPALLWRALNYLAEHDGSIREVA